LNNPEEKPIYQVPMTMQLLKSFTKPSDITNANDARISSFLFAKKKTIIMNIQTC